MIKVLAFVVALASFRLRLRSWSPAPRARRRCSRPSGRRTAPLATKELWFH